MLDAVFRILPGVYLLSWGNFVCCPLFRFFRQRVALVMGMLCLRCSSHYRSGRRVAVPFVAQSTGRPRRASDLGGRGCLLGVWIHTLDLSGVRDQGTRCASADCEDGIHRVVRGLVCWAGYRRFLFRLRVVIRRCSMVPSRQSSGLVNVTGVGGIRGDNAGNFPARLVQARGSRHSGNLGDAVFAALRLDRLMTNYSARSKDESAFVLGTLLRTPNKMAC